MDGEGRAAGHAGAVLLVCRCRNRIGTRAGRQGGRAGALLRRTVREMVVPSGGRVQLVACVADHLFGGLPPDAAVVGALAWPAASAAST